MDDIPRTTRPAHGRLDFDEHGDRLQACSWRPTSFPSSSRDRTAIGATKAAKFLVIGLGVVGLQAVATAKTPGGSIMAEDIRDEARKAGKPGRKIVGFESRPSWPSARRLCQSPAGGMDREGTPGNRTARRAADIVILSALVHGEVAPVLSPRKSSSA